MGDAIVRIFLGEMEAAYFVAMSLCVLAGMLVFFLRQIIRWVRASVTVSKIERKKTMKITILRTIIGLIFVPFVVAYFPEISAFLFQIEGGTQIAPVSALGSGMGIDRIIDVAITTGRKKNGVVGDNKTGAGNESEKTDSDTA